MALPPLHSAAPPIVLSFAMTDNLAANAVAAFDKNAGIV
jgi:hypothetical protein